MEKALSENILKELKFEVVQEKLDIPKQDSFSKSKTKYTTTSFASKSSYLMAQSSTGFVTNTASGIEVFPSSGNQNIPNIQKSQPQALTTS